MLYEDDGETFAFRRGDYRVTHFPLEADGWPPQRLRLTRRFEGGYASPITAFDVVVHGLTEPPALVTCDGQALPADHTSFDASKFRLAAGSFGELGVEWS